MVETASGLVCVVVGSGIDTGLDGGLLKEVTHVRLPLFESESRLEMEGRHAESWLHKPTLVFSSASGIVGMQTMTRVLRSEELTTDEPSEGRTV